MKQLVAPFPWFGGKRKVASLVWEAIGDVPNYVEPFAGSLAVLLARPPGHKGGVETANDMDGLLCNFWRALSLAPDEVARYADWPISECVPGGTMIATPRGTIPIESIQVGDVVLGYDGGRVVPAEVTGTKVSDTTSELVRVSDTLLTPNHPVWTREHGYIPAGHLEIGDTIAVLENLADEPGFSILFRRHEFRECQSSHPQGVSVQCPTLAVRVYNLETSTHNYFANNLLVHNCDMHARHAWLVSKKPDITSRLCGDPEWYDAKAAGWWVWGICCWIGSGWCSGEGAWQSVNGELVRRVREESEQGEPAQGVSRKRPHLKTMDGINRQIPMLSGNQGLNSENGSVSRKRPRLDALSGVNSHVDVANGIVRQMPRLGGACGVNSQDTLDGDFIAGDIDGDVYASGTADVPSGVRSALRDVAIRVRKVRLTCGDWSRVCGPSVTHYVGLTGVFLDPPYSGETGRADVYSHEDFSVAHDVRKWCIENGGNKLMRIVLAGYEGEHNELESHGWKKKAWSAGKGYAGQRKTGENENGKLERLWISPHCRSGMDLFEFGDSGNAAD
jgi:site-specific DNA-adenine methylase